MVGGTLCMFPHLLMGDVPAYKTCWLMAEPLVALPPISPHPAPALGFLMGQALSCLWAFVSPVGQEFGSSLAGWLWLRVSHEVAGKVSARATVT